MKANTGRAYRKSEAYLEGMKTDPYRERNDRVEPVRSLPRRNENRMHGF